MIKKIKCTTNSLLGMGKGQWAVELYPACLWNHRSLVETSFEIVKKKIFWKRHVSVIKVKHSLGWTKKCAKNKQLKKKHISIWDRVCWSPACSSVRWPVHPTGHPPILPSVRPTICLSCFILELRKSRFWGWINFKWPLDTFFSSNIGLTGYIDAPQCSFMNSLCS